MANGRQNYRTSTAEIEKLKTRVVDLCAKGHTIDDALLKVGRSRGTYNNWRAADENFRNRMDVARGFTHASTSEKLQADVADFAGWRRKFLKSETFAHQQSWVDLLEGRQPSFVDGCAYEPAKNQNLLVVNTPPNFSKSTILSADYPTYRICMNPNIKILLVSKTQNASKKQLYAVKQRLTHPKYADLQMAYSPEGGFKANADSWTATQLYLKSDDYEGQKDPTIEALGMGGQIYGARADLIILDDCVTLSNAHEWEKQMDWLRQEVFTRLPPTGKLLVVGTRVAPTDLYRELRNPDHYYDGRIPWTYYAQPAVLDYGDEGPEGWKSLWPKSDRPFEGAEEETPDENGHYSRWTGERLDNVRNLVGPQKWAMVYQQQDVSEETVFHPVAVRGSVTMRTAGALKKGVPGHPDDPEAYIVICGLDPAVTVRGHGGDAAAVAYAVHPGTGRRLVLDAKRITSPTAEKLQQTMFDFTERYRPREWVIEINGFNGYITQDRTITQWMAARGVGITAHHTGKNKMDAQFGITAMSPLFGTVTRHEGRAPIHNKDNVIELPRSDGDGIKSLIEQLIVWHRDTKGKTDMVMALWFAELRALESVFTAKTASQHYTPPDEFTTQGELDEQVVINIQDYMEMFRSA